MIAATRLFVGNLPDNTEEKDLHAAFSVFGDIENVDLKCKTGTENKKFAFVSLATSHGSLESCINHFSNKDFNGNRLYVTRARESFLERLQRERQQTQKLKEEKASCPTKLHKQIPIIKLGDKLTPRKRKVDNVTTNNVTLKTKKHNKTENVSVNYTQTINPAGDTVTNNKHSNVNNEDIKKHEAERKRVESLKKKRQEFKEKQMIIKTGLTRIDKIQNKKLTFTDFDDDNPKEAIQQNKKKTRKENNKNTLFDDDEDSETEVNFEVKKQFEGKKGQKVLDLQSRYKSDKRFTLDERFIEDDETSTKQESDNEEIEIGQADEKAKQLNILQDVLGITIKTRTANTDNKMSKPRLGMLRFDPMQPDHAKFLAPVEAKPETTKKSKKKSKDKQEEIKESQLDTNVPKVEVSKEQFYKVSETLKETIAQPNTFSLRSLFGNNDNVDEGPQEQDTNYIPLEKPKEKKKVKNPLEPTEKNPFVYDSSDSETEEVEKVVKVELPPAIETKAVWKENLFFSKTDSRLKDGLAFFTKTPENEIPKERRELKSLVKKRIYNKDRKTQMFKNKIGGRKKSVKKPYKNKN